MLPLRSAVHIFPSHSANVAGFIMKKRSKMINGGGRNKLWDGGKTFQIIITVPNIHPFILGTMKYLDK